MNAFSFVLAIGAIAMANAVVVAPYNPFANSNAFTAFTPQVVSATFVPKQLESQQTYDDGSYTPHSSEPLKFIPSPYGYVPAGSGLEGQYVPDNLEKLYDDGSYKPQANYLPLISSPYGYVVAGSGLEGQYVPDQSEKLFDDGSYKPEQEEKENTSEEESD